MMSVIDENGIERFLGNNPAPMRYIWTVYGDGADQPLILRSQWKPITLQQWTPPIKDQDGIGACNAFDTINVMEAVRNLEGLPYIPLSCGYLYGNINGQQDRGSLLEDAIKWMIERGTVPESNVPSLAWQRSMWPSNATILSAPYKILEFFWCPTFDHMASAIQSGFFVSDGIMWYDNFKIDGDGWLPARGSGRPGGHALMRDELAFRNGVWGLGGPNSWGQRWGANGRMVMPESLHTGPVGGWWAARSTRIEGDQ